MRDFFQKDKLSTQDEICLKRAKFYADLHRQVSYGSLSIADAERKVAEYDHPTQSHSQPILSEFQRKTREIPLLRTALSIK